MPSPRYLGLRKQFGSGGRERARDQASEEEARQPHLASPPFLVERFPATLTSKVKSK